MAKNNVAVSTKLMSASSSRGSPLADRLNRQVLQTLRDLAVEIETDPGIEDEYEFEIFGNAGPDGPKKKKKHP
jgi:hypothetical protein